MPKRLEPDEEALFAKIIAEKQREGVLLFGRYLSLKGLISDEDIFNARMFQKGQNLRIGEIAMSRGMLSRDDVERLLVYQEETGMRFGELAAALGFITNEQLAELLEAADQSYIYFGEALVAIGVLEEPVMLVNLQSFRRLQLEGAEHTA